MNAIPLPRKALKIDMPRLATVGDAFVLVGRSGFAHLRANEPCVRLGRSTEGIHQLRVSVRRLRSALALFRDLMPDRERRYATRRLKWIADRCARAREWDVFCDEVLRPLSKTHSCDRALYAFTNEADGLRRAADVRVAEMLTGARYGKNITEAEFWWTDGEWLNTDNELSTAKAYDYSRARIRKFHQRLCRLGRRVDTLDAKELHKLRIRTKKLRYAIDFFGSLFPRSAVQPYRRALSEIQECLGVLNDITATHSILAAVEKNTPTLDSAGHARAVRLITAWNAARWKSGVDRLPCLWRRFAGLRPFWE